MSFSRLPQQYRVNDGRQIFTPDDLHPGMHIAVANVVEGAGFGTKIFRVGVAVTGLVARQPNITRRQAAHASWRHNNGGLLPLWHGIVDQIDEDVVVVEVRGEAESDQVMQIGHDPLALPTAREPYVAMHSFDSIGLAPTRPAARPLSPIEARYAELDRVWQPVVTLRIEQ